MTGQINPTPDDGGQKTFTQDDVNRIITERITRERKNLEDREQKVAQWEVAIAQKQYDDWAANLLTASRLPLELAGALPAGNKECLEKVVEILKTHNLIKVFPNPGSGANGGAPFSNEPTDELRKAMGLPEK